MAAIKAALVHSLGGVPLIEMYRQATIRHQKAHEWQEALRWAERGVATYGTEALRADFVDELTHRIQVCREKLRPKAAAAPVARAQMRSNVVETLTCSQCGKSFERIVTAGRKPLLCNECRQAVSTKDPANIADRIDEKH